jgi:MFS family permease
MRSGRRRGGTPVSSMFRSWRVAPVAAIALGVLALALGLANVPLDVLAHQPVPGGPAADWLVRAAIVPEVGVATVLAARRPRNPIGWILLAIFLLSAAPASQYAVLDYRMRHGTLPLGGVAVALLGVWPIWLVLIAILLWLFPDGQLPPGRGRGVAVALIATGVLAGLAASASGVVAVAEHDIGLNASGSLTTYQNGAWSILHGGLVVAVLASWSAWLAAQVPRYRRSAGERRQQLKWLYSGAAVFVAAAFVAFLSPANSSALSQVATNLTIPLGFAAFAVCIGVAVLKYRLYEIDRIISRVISYAIITAVLAGVFTGVVVLATDVLPFTSPVGVAASTLVAAALFNPLRRRVQRAVDRRFNRARYDADKTVAAFAARLKEAVDLDAVLDDLASAVQQTLEPAHVSLWISPRD